MWFEELNKLILVNKCNLFFSQDGLVIESDCDLILINQSGVKFLPKSKKAAGSKKSKKTLKSLWKKYYC